jgi:uncharacterized repeat protein (TIGR01451 family)
MPTRAFRQVLFLIALSESPLAQATSTISLFSSPNPATSGAAVTITALVRPLDATGRVTFYDGAQIVGIGIVHAGRALTVAHLSATRVHSLHAHYSGDASHLPGDSAVAARSGIDIPPRKTPKPRTDNPASYLISTIAGRGLPPTPLPGASALFPQPSPGAVDQFGNLYFSDALLNAVFMLSPGGVVTRVAGTGSPGYSGDNGPALSAQLNSPLGVAVDGAGNVYIAEFGNSLIRQVSPNGVITTAVPNVSGPFGVAVDSAGNLYIPYGGNLVAKVTPGGVMTTLAGNGTYGYSGDNGPATSAQLNLCSAVAVDAYGDVFLADSSNQRIREVLPNGIIITVAGNGVGGYWGDNGPATSAELAEPQGLAVDTSGNLYIADTGNNRVREVTSDGTITTIAGTGVFGFAGDGLAATSASLADPYGLAVDSTGNLYIADYVDFRIREVSAGIISTVVGGGSGDAVSAPMSTFTSPGGTAKDNLGNLYVSDGNRVHLIGPSGSMSTVAGTGLAGYSGDNGPASAAQLNGPSGLAIGPDGALYIADTVNHAVRKVIGGSITTVAGIGSEGYTGDGASATAAQLAYPGAVTVDSSGDIFIADTGNEVIRRVAPNGVISTVAGNGTSGLSGDGGAATLAQLYSPTGVAVDSAGNLYIADSFNNDIRKVDTSGIITTVAGSGNPGFDGDGEPATEAHLQYPRSVAVDSAGNIYIADLANDRIRLVTTDGIIHTIGGGGLFPGSGDGTSALSASLTPYGMTLDIGGDIYFIDEATRLVRVLTLQGGPALFTISSAHSGNFPQGSSGQYTLSITNAAPAGPTAGTITVTDFLPEGLTLSSMTGDGWDCTGNACSRADVWNGGTILPEITVSVSVSPTAPTQVMNQVSVSGGGSTTAGTQDITVVSVPTTIQTSPPGLQFIVDGLTSQSAPQTVDLVSGPHTIFVSSPQAGSAGVQYVFTGWSDSDSYAATRTINVIDSPATYTANFKTQYKLTTAAFPSSEGSVSPSTGSFFDAGSSVTLTATPSTSNPFSFWSGGASGTANPISLTLTAPASVTANFFTCAITGDATAGIADVQQIVNEALGISPGLHDLNQDGVVNVADIQKVIGAALGGPCLY